VAFEQRNIIAVCCFASDGTRLNGWVAGNLAIYCSRGGERRLGGRYYHFAERGLFSVPTAVTALLTMGVHCS